MTSSLMHHDRSDRADRSVGERHPLKVWPYTWASLGWFAAAYVTMVATWTLLGLAVTRWFAPTDLGQGEVDLVRWFEDRRTGGLDTAAHLSSVPSDTYVVVATMAVFLVAFPLLWRRWHEWALLLGALALETAVYVSSNFLVGRPRPPVERMEEIVTDSFPSGHMAAAVTFYGGLLIITSWRTTSRPIRVAVAAMGVLIALAVAVSRLYLGVHYVTDLLGGVLLGLTSLAVALTILRRGLAQEVAKAPDRVPPHTADLDRSDAGPRRAS